MAKMKLVLLVEVDEEKLLPGNAFTVLPDKMYDLIAEALPNGALELSSMHLVNPKRNVERVINLLALNYHHYTVSVRGEPCEEEDCEQHDQKNVIDFHDRRHRNFPAPGIN
jgi:hypothetical protein